MIKTSLTFHLSAGLTDGIAIDPSTSTLDHGRNVTLPKSGIHMCDYDARAGLYLRQGLRLRDQGFPHASLAIRYANDELSSHQLRSCTMEVEDHRFDGTEIQALYGTDRYPLRARKAAGT